MYMCSLRRGVASVLFGQQLQAAAALSSSAAAAAKAAASKHKGKPDDPPFHFKAKCRGVRVESPEAAAMRERLHQSDFGAPRRKPSAAEHAAGQDRGNPARPMHTSPAWFGADSDARSTDDAAQELTEKGSKRLMQSEDGREELRQGTFDLDTTTERVLEEGKKDASPGAAARADDADMKESVKARVVSGSQTS